MIVGLGFSLIIYLFFDIRFLDNYCFYFSEMALEVHIINLFTGFVKMFVYNFFVGISIAANTNYCSYPNLWAESTSGKQKLKAKNSRGQPWSKPKCQW